MLLSLWCYSLLTDEGRLRGTKTLELRARQNVVFELGYFRARLGAGSVCAVMGEGVKKPSDIDGVTFIRLDSHDGWKAALAREIKASGIGVDFNRTL
ncbi:MAG: DNA-binding protein [Bryobacterales bacterium]|nr:DNA-binding protein [Bryobacterales bacterium]